MEDILTKIRHKLIVSCQGYDCKTFHSADDMLMMANAAAIGGCVGFRLNSPDYIRLVRKNFPKHYIIGIWKKESPGSNVYITPDVESIFALKESGANIIALDATNSTNYLGDYGWETIKKAKEIDPSLIIMADISNFSEAKSAVEAGADIISTTMSGYTDYTLDKLDGPDFNLIKKCKEELDTFVICEGRIWTREDAVKCYEAGADCIVVGTAITNPKLITKRYVDFLKENKIWD
ncbi:N-acetylmannosamine-6-phosphate 2-epimerase [Anaerorhabdus sp.]|uniref:N-acetylmannosamine-6-phosphate 2-epimerase n=1 Tax=Anaerorhabdus sp. TaxID=1872524 RepID=UPI002FCC97AF